MDDDTALKAAITAARVRAAKVGPMHSLWDSIFDAEAIIGGGETLAHYPNREEAVRQLMVALAV